MKDSPAIWTSKSGETSKSPSSRDNKLESRSVDAGADRATESGSGGTGTGAGARGKKQEGLKAHCLCWMQLRRIM